MTGKAAIVTGGAQGLGAAVCLALAMRGFTVAVADINAAGAASTANACGAGAFAVPVDLSTAVGAPHMIAACVDQTRRLDVLVNCAAAAPAEAFLEMTGGN